MTLFTLLLTAFQVLLHRMTGQDGIAVGTPVAGRRSRQVRDLVGYFVNPIVLRADFSGAPTFQELLSAACAAFTVRSWGRSRSARFTAKRRGSRTRGSNRS